MSRESLFKKVFQRKENVCSHLGFARDNNSLQGLRAYPLCVQTYDDGYELFWYCSKCIKEYGLSTSGVYVYDEEDDLFGVIGAIEGLEVGDDLDMNPFKRFIDEQSGSMLSLEEFNLLEYDFDDSQPLAESRLLKIPFGAIKRYS